MILQTKIIIGLLVILAINLWVLLAVYRKGDTVTRVADSLKAREEHYKLLADSALANAQLHIVAAAYWSFKYDSMQEIATAATQKANKLSRQYEDLLRHPRVFTSDHQRDSVLNALYPR